MLPNAPSEPDPLEPPAKKQRKARLPQPIPLGGRMTRSASLRQQESKKREEEAAKTVQGSRSSSSAARPTVSSSSKQLQPPKTPRSTPAKTPISARKPPPPFSTTQSSTFTFTFPPPNSGATSNKPPQSSSLSSLSNALDKLNMPPPSRPSSSLGFNDALPNASTRPEAPKAPPASSQPSTSFSNDARTPSSSTRAAVPLRKSATASDLSGRPPLRQTTLPFAPPSNAKPRVPGLSSGRPSGPPSSSRPVFGVGMLRGGLAARGRVGQKVSQKSSLPVVEGSPVKGEADAHDDSSGTQATGGSKEPPPLPSLDISMELAMTTTDEKGKGKAKALDVEMMPPPPPPAVDGDGKGKRREAEPWKRDASRRASLASHLLSTMSALPQTSAGGALATPNTETRPAKATSKYASVGSRSAPPRTGISAALRSAAASPSTPEGTDARPMAVLKECSIFVDVRTDDGDNAGALFVDMLKGMGARIPTRVGPTCTHIVFKNGLMSTLTRYRLLNEPRPFVVGIAWVVECAEQRTRVDETRFLIDLGGMNVAGSNKRRRSMLPKSPARMGPSEVPNAGTSSKARLADRAGDVLPSPTPTDEGDSFGRSSLNGLDDSGLAPLEKARRRRSMMLKS